MKEEKKKIKIDDITGKQELSKNEMKKTKGGVLRKIPTKLGINGGDCKESCDLFRGTEAEWQGVDDFK
ncbi:MAG: hypothetical protein JXB48_07810 [Candidatus Latescibacteria bacterium]|nr:hypothetical protein [Candidatus Latescibacterota bacterium]